MGAENDIVSELRGWAGLFGERTPASGCMTEAAAEIVRLRGEVGPVNFRYFAGGPKHEFACNTHAFAEHVIRLLGEDRDDWTITDMQNPTGDNHECQHRRMNGQVSSSHARVECADCHKVISDGPIATQTIAPAEAKGDLSSRMYRGPSHPDTERANLLDRRSIAEESPQPADGGAVACDECGGRGWVDHGHEHDDGRISSAPENCPECDGKGTHPPAAQVQQEATLPVVIFGETYDVPIRVQLHIEHLRMKLEAIGQAAQHHPITDLLDATEHCLSAADEGVDYAVSRPMLDAMTTLGLMEKVRPGKWAPTDTAKRFATLATHPAGDALGAEDTELLRWLIANELIVHRLKDNGRWMIVTGDLSPAIDGSEHDTPREAIRAAIQHRGDSQEVSRG